MESPGFLIAEAVVILYFTIGPIILFAIYTLFDSLIHDDPNGGDNSKTNKKSDPALWSGQELDDYFRDQN